jgi:anti-sigma28 factor (negative regulator of flagellin synthesis)
MADIANTGSLIGGSSGALHLHTASAVRGPLDLSSRTVEIDARRSSGADRVEVSEVARWLEEMNRLPAVREDKVAAARAAIANGTLDSDESLSIALDRLIDEI